ncbi:MAG: DUF2341 domain-containing protein, partial [Candidatus Magnetomorum sp.]|nr:DUF2341 domain-containing protein [Candidatus Magnetomorum sp.]
LLVNASGELLSQDSVMNIYHGLHVQSLGKMTLQSTTLTIGMGDQLVDTGFKVSNNALVYFQNSTLVINDCAGATHPSIQFDVVSQLQFSDSHIVFQPLSETLSTMHASFGGKKVGPVYVKMIHSNQILKLVTNSAEMDQLVIESGTFDPNGQTLRIVGNQTGIVIGDSSSNDDAILAMSSGNIQVISTGEKICALRIHQDGHVAISGGSFSRNLSLNDTYEKVLWIDAGGVFEQSGGMVIINNQYGDYHWGTWIDSGATFQLRGGVFENDSRIACYGLMDLDGGHLKISSGANETQTAFDIFEHATIQARNTTFSRYSNASASSGINIHEGAYLGTLPGDDDDDFDRCNFQEWYIDGCALTFSNGESFTITEPLFNHTGGLNIMQKTTSTIYVTGNDTGTRGGERFDSDPEGSQINTIHWENTCRLTGKNATGLAVSPSEDETLYYASGYSVPATGELLSGTVIHWIIIPPDAATPENGDGLHASFTINKSAEIVWYSGTPGQWTGAVSNEWTDPANWSDHEVPDYTVDVLIAGKLNHYPVLNDTLYVYQNSGEIQCRSLKLESYAALTSRSNVMAYSAIQIKGGTWLQESNEDNAIQVGAGGIVKLLGGTLSLGQVNQDNQTDLLIKDGGLFQIEAGDAYIVDSLHVESNGTVQINGGNVLVGQYLGDLSRTPHAVFQVDANARLYMNGGAMYVQSPCCGDTTGILFDPSATIACTSGEMIFRSVRSEQTQIDVDFGGHSVYQVRINMYSPDHRFVMTGHDAQFCQLVINKGQFDIDAKTLSFDGPGPSIILGDQEGDRDATLLLSTGGTVNVNQNTKGVKALLIQSDGQFLMSGGQLNRNVFIEDTFDAIIHVASGGLFQQTDGQVLIDNQTSDYHWGVWIDSGGQFLIHGGEFYNDARTRCYGNMQVVDSTYYVSSACNETSVNFLIENDASIQAQNATFSRYCNTKGLLIKSGARIGETIGDDADDFDQCRFENWSSVGAALTVENSESLTIVQPVFENTGGVNIDKASAGQIVVTGSSTGTRGGERYDSDPEGGMANYIDWFDTSSLTGQSNSAKAVQPGDGKTQYYTSGTQVLALGTGLPLSWEITPVNSVSVSAGINTPAEFVLNADATITWYSIKPGLWRGHVSSEWSEPGNWDDGNVPDETLNVTIPYTCNYAPVIHQPVACNTLTLDQNAQLTVASMTLTVNGHLITHTESQLNNGNGVIAIYGDFHNTGTFNAQTGTIVLSGYSNCQVMDNGTEPVVFNRLIINKFNSSVITFGDVRINNALVLKKGSPHFAGTLEYAPEAKLTYAGQTDRIMGTEFNALVPPINIIINAQASVLLSNTLEIVGHLTISSGFLVIGDHDLRIHQGAVLDGSFSNTAMIVTNGAGSLIREISQPGGIAFPIGDMTAAPGYSPFTLVFNSGEFTDASVSVQTKNEKITENFSVSTYVDRYWRVTSSGISNYSCTVFATTEASDIQGTRNGLYFGRWDGSNWFLMDPVHDTYPMFSGTVQDFGIFTGGEQDVFENRIIISGYLNHFCGVQSGGVSEEKTYAVAGKNLLSDIIITPPPEFEISTTSGTGFIAYPATMRLERQQTTIPETQLYVRFKPTFSTPADAPNYISHTSDHADTKKVITSGSGLYIRTITLSAPTPTDGIQVKVILNQEIFDYGHVLSGGSDIRFKKGQDIFSYWIQEWNPQGESILWVRILNADVSSFDMEYGNTDTTPLSNGPETFELFDDFSGTALDDQRWRTQNVSTTLSDGMLYVSSSGTNGGISSVQPFDSTDTYSYVSVFQATITTGNSFILFGFSGSTDPWQPRTGIYAYKNLGRFGTQNGAVTTSHATNKEIALYDENISHFFSVGLNQDYYFDDNRLDFEGDPVSTAYATIATYLNGSKAVVDWAYVRKSALPEILSTVGSECNMPGGGIWMGEKSSDWSDPENWNSGGVPKNSDNVIIPANSPNMPRLTATSNCKNIEIKRNASLNLANYPLNVYGEWKNSGTFIPQTGTICFRGDTDIDASGLGPDTQIFGDTNFSQKYTFAGDFYLGYKFKPTEDITIFSFRSFFGTKISLWTATGRLLTTLATTGEDAKWVDHALPEPLALTGNESYVLAAYTGGKPYYLNSSVSSEFTNGILQESRSSNGGVYPGQLSSVKWWLVDIIYKTGSGSGFESFHQLIIQKSGNHELIVRSAHIENRLTIKSGRFSVSGILSYAPSAALEYATNDDYTTFPSEFPEIDGPQNLILNSSGTVSLDFDRTINGRLTVLNGSLRLGAHTLSLGPDASVVISNANALIATDGTGSLRQYITGPRTCLFPVGTMTPSPQYSPLMIDVLSAQLIEPAYLDIRVENSSYTDTTPSGIITSWNRHWRIQPNNISDLHCELTAKYLDDDIPESTIEKNSFGAFWDGIAWTELNRVDLGKNVFDGSATDPLIVSTYEKFIPNALPTSENKSFVLTENTSYAFTRTDFEFFDDDPYDTFKAIRIIQLPGAGQLTYQTAPAQNQQIIEIESLGQFLFTPAVNENGDNYAFIKFQVQDSDLGWSESSYTFTMNVFAVNKAPQISQNGPIQVTMSEDLSPISWNFPAIDAVDPDGDTLMWQVLVQPEHGQAFVQGMGMSPSAVQYTPDKDFYGQDQWVISVQDMSKEPLSDTIVVQVTVEPVNDPPLFDCGPKKIVVMEDFATPLVISVTPVAPPANESSQTITYYLVPETNSLINAAIHPTNGTVTVSRLPDKNGVLSLDIVATDQQTQNSLARQTIAITVIAVNDPPLFHLDQYEIEMIEDFSQVLSVTVIPEIVPSDETSQSVHYYLSPSEIEFVDLSIDVNTGKVMINSVPNGNGRREIKLWANYGQTVNHLAEQSLLINVVSVNDPPTFHLSRSYIRLLQDFQDTEIIEVIPSPVPVDEEQQTLAFSLSPSSVMFANVTLDPGTGTIQISKVNQGIGMQTFVVTAVDGQTQNYSSAANFTLEIIPEMPPLDIHLSRNVVTVQEDFSHIETIDTILVTDDYYTNRSVAYSLTPSAIDFAQLSINANTGEITITRWPDGNGVQTITVIATDLVDPDLSATDTFALNVLAVNDPPNFQLSETQVICLENESTPTVINIVPMPQPQDETSQAVTYSVSPMNSALLTVTFDPLQNKIEILPKPDLNGHQTLTVTAQEQAPENNIVIKQIFVTVIGVNTPPVFELSTQHIQVLEDFLVPVTLTVNPMDQPADEIGQSVSYSLSPSELNFIQMSIDQHTGNVTFTSILDQFGQATVKVVAHEDYVVQNSDYIQPFDVMVQSVNDPPLFRVNKKIVQVPEDFSTTEIITITPEPSPLNEADQVVTYSLLPEKLDFVSIDINEITGAISIQHIQDKNGSETLTIIADDHGISNNQVTNTIDLIVYPVNDPPDFTLSQAAMTLIEDFTQTESVQVIPLKRPSDEMGQALSYSMMPPEIDFAEVSIDPVTGEIHIAKKNNYHGFQRFSIMANDLEPENNVASHYFDLTVVSENDPPLFRLSETSISIKEGFNEAIVIDVIPESVPDDEKQQLVTYYLTPQSVDFININIQADTGQITIDNEQQKNGSQVFVVTATDHQFENYSAKVEFSVSVRPANDPPIFHLSQSSVLLSEDFEQAVTVAVVPAPIPPDESDQIITYSIMPDQIDFAHLSFDSDSGCLTITRRPDANGVQTFTITADDHQLVSNVYAQTFKLEVSPVNDPPVMTLNKYTLTLDEDFSTSETIFCVSGMVPSDETSQTVVYRLSPVTCDFADLQIVPSSGRVTIQGVTDKNGSGWFDIIADDGQKEHGLFTQSFFLTVQAVNDPPEFSLNGNEWILTEDFTEDIHITVTPGKIPMDEQQQTVRYSLDPQSTPFATVNLNTVTGEITVRSRGDENGIQTFKLIANDFQSQHQYYEQTFTLHVQAQNDAPKFTLSRYSVSVDEDFTGTENILVIPGFPPSDEVSQTIHYRLNPTSVNFASLSIHPDTGVIQIKSVSNGNGNQLFSVIADDGQAVNNTSTAQFSLTVAPINDPPKFVLSSHELNFVEDFDLIQTVFSNLDTVPSDEFKQDIRFSIETQTPVVADVSIDRISGKLTIKAIPNANGSQVFTVIADDGQWYQSRYEDTLTLHIQAINDPPKFSLDKPSIVVNEDFTDAHWISVIPDIVPLDETNQTIIYQITPEDSDIIQASIDAATGKIQLTAQADQNGTQEFTLIANDGQSSNYLATQSFSVTVVAVNDPPAFSLSPPALILEEGFSDIQRVDIVMEPPPLDERDQLITYRLTPETMDLAKVWIVPEEKALFVEKIDDNHFGFSQVMVTAHDGQTHSGIASQIFSLTLTSVNDAPIAHESGFTVFEDECLQGQLVADDPDGDSLLFQLARQANKGIVLIHADSGAFVYTPFDNVSGDDNFLFVVGDGQVMSHIAMVSIHITEVNDLPIISPVSDQLLMEGILPEPLTINLSDHDGGDVRVWVTSSNTSIVGETGLEIIEGSGIPYVATVSTSEPHTFHLQITPQKGIAGQTMIQVKAIDALGGESIQVFKMTIEKYLISATYGNNGSCVPAGEIPVNTGSNITFGFYPDTNYEVDRLSIDGNFMDSAIYSNSYTFKAISNHHTLSVTFKRSVSIFVNFLTSDPREGYAPLTVSFVSQIQGNVSRLVWDFGDGTTSSLANPIHVYAAGGYHTVRLTAYGSEGSKSIEKTKYILVKSRKIQGRVVAQDTGFGLSGYTVEVWQGAGDFLATAMTDINGQYVLTDLPKGNDLVISAWPPYGKANYFKQFYRNKDTFQQADIVSTLENDLTNIDFFLERAPEIGIQGCVLSEVGNLNSGVPGVQVDIFSNGVMFGTAVYTDETGCYSATHLKPSDDYRVSVWYEASGLDYYYAVPDVAHIGLYHPTYSVSRWQKSTGVTPADPAIKKIDIILDLAANQRGTIKGTVYKSDGTPLPGVWVSAISDVLDDQNSALSDAYGRYTILELTPVSYEDSLEKGYIVEIDTDNYP